MKITAGLGSIDYYIRLVEAGADEVFCGFVPYEWNKEYGSLFPYIKANIHLSGECAEINSLSVNFFKRFNNIKRIIFHRKNTISDMKACITTNDTLEYEAFILNEKCHFTGAFCGSLHCDELNHLCKIPYDLGKINKNCNDFVEVDNRINKYYESLNDEDIEEKEGYLFGSTGCGLCALKDLKEAGVTQLKVVGRGNSIDNMEQDVRSLKKALEFLDSGSYIDYSKEVKKKIFHNKKCSNECYYK